MAISSDNDRLTIIISKKLKSQLKEYADIENRSLSNYIVTVLESHIQQLKTPVKINEFDNLVFNQNIVRDTNRELGNTEQLPRDKNVTLVKVEDGKLVEIKDPTYIE